MTALDGPARIWLDWIAPASWQIAILAAAVGLLAVAARSLSSRLRYALWLIVLAKVFLPPTLTAPWSIGRWTEPFLASASSSGAQRDMMIGAASLAIDVDDAQAARKPESNPGTVSLPVTLLALWATGCVIFWSAAAWGYARILRGARGAAVIDEGPLRVLLERLALGLRISRPPEMLSMKSVPAPFLFGVLSPRIVLPEALEQLLDESQLRAVLAHELIHCRRRDTLIGWIQLTAQGLFWFHPCVWWANARLRHERECVCDEETLAAAAIAPRRYSETMFRILANSRGRSMLAGSFVGILERGGNLQNRLEEIMKYDSKKRTFGWLSRAAVAAFALLLVPMGPWSSTRGGDEATSLEGEWKVIQMERAGRKPPQELMKTLKVVITAETFTMSDERGFEAATYALDRGASPNQIDLVFTEGENKDVIRKAAGIFELQGDDLKVAWQKDGQPRPKEFLSVPGQRTSELLVLQRAEAPAAGDETNRKPPYPVIVETNPKVGATDIDPSLKEITVTFDRDMGKGMSWTGGPPLFPPVDKSRKAEWKDARTCVLPVKLEKGAYYRVGINSKNHQNFRAADGTPPLPSAIYFVTAGATDDVRKRVEAPKIASIEPANGAKDVDPATKELRVTFNVPMGEGMSWTESGSPFPRTPDGQKAAWSEDKLSCTLPVSLDPDHDYRVGLNNPSHINFQSEWGVPLEPVVYEFRTRAAEK